MRCSILLKGVALCLGLLTLTAEAQTTLIYDNFNRVGVLTGSTPVTTYNGANWYAFNNATPATFSTSGTVLTGQLGLSQHALIDMGASYFNTHPAVYTMSADITMPTNASSTAWMSLGFVQNTSLATMAGFGGNFSGDGSPWVLVRENGAAKVFQGVGASNVLYDSASTSIFTTGVPVNVSLVLNTSLAQWTLDAYVGATQLDLNGASAGNTFTYTTNPSLQWVGLSDSGTGGTEQGLIDNFTLLSSVPEPSTIAMLLGSCSSLLLWGTRRSRRSAATS